MWARIKYQGAGDRGRRDPARRLAVAALVKLNKIYTRTGDDGTTGPRRRQPLQQGRAALRGDRCGRRSSTARWACWRWRSKPQRAPRGRDPDPERPVRPRRRPCDPWARISRRSEMVLRIVPSQVDRRSKPRSTRSTNISTPLAQLHPPRRQRSRGARAMSRVRRRGGPNARDGCAGRRSSRSTRRRSHYINRLSDYLFVLARAINAARRRRCCGCRAANPPVPLSAGRLASGLAAELRRMDQWMVGVIGAGQMGSGIAQTVAQKGMHRAARRCRHRAGRKGQGQDRQALGAAGREGKDRRRRCRGGAREDRACRRLRADGRGRDHHRGRDRARGHRSWPSRFSASAMSTLSASRTFMPFCATVWAIPEAHLARADHAYLIHANRSFELASPLLTVARVLAVRPRLPQHVALAAGR